SVSRMDDHVMDERRNSSSSRLSVSSPTPSDILKDVVAYVEVRTANDNRSAAVKRVLERMGAKVEEKFTDEVTHVIFKEGKKRTHDRAVKRGVHLVSVLWVDQCKEKQELVPESSFVANTDYLTTPPPGVRWKKCKSMQPRDFDEEVALSAERCERRRKRVASANRFRLEEGATPYSSPGQVLVLETQPRSPFLGIALQSPSSITIPNTPPSMQARIDQLQRQKEAKAPLQETEELIENRLHTTDTSSKPASPSVSLEAAYNKSPPTVLQSGTDAAETARLSETVTALEHASQKTKSAQDSQIPDKTVLGMGPAKRPCRRSVRLSMPAVSKLPLAVSSPVKTSSQSAGQGGSLPSSVQKKLDSRSPQRHRTRSNPESAELGDGKSQRVHKRKSMGTYLTSEKDATQSFKENKRLAKSRRQSSVIRNGVIRDQVCPETEGTHVRASVERVQQSDDSPKSNKSKRRSSLLLKQTNSASACTTVTKSSQSSEAGSSQSGNNSVNSTTGSKKRKLLNPCQDLHSILSPVQTSTAKDMPKKSAAANESNGVGKKGRKRKSCNVNDVFPEELPVSKKGPKSSQSKENRKIVEAGDSEKNTEEEDSDGVAGKQTGTQAVKNKRVSSRKVGKAARDKTYTENDSVLSSSKTNSILGSSMSMVLDDSSASAFFMKRLAPPRPSIAEFQVKKVSRRQSRRPISLSSVSENESSTSSGGDRTRRRASSQQHSNLKSKPSIVMTSLHRPEQELVISVVRRLGGFILEDNVSSHTTHLICGKQRRTLNVLHAIARGCWVLSKEWLERLTTILFLSLDILVSLRVSWRQRCMLTDAWKVRHSAKNQWSRTFFE
ncbi:hypothetical protein BaRGS_00016836, partial [Batillaria attramentaria]